ncbi:plasmid mobilization protein [Pedobacter sp. GR22-10]|uniref:plasmid mobilization protein n=1 Tax=Pedobacter sp. GR22-10 TaxID=2994472 RepID=UPI002246A14B|nr:hypothetical protein [Pedobacter sp. GR22-10]MCX2432843.1 hypothetical protein [Pedobacter sp. GR22-10]
MKTATTGSEIKKKRVPGRPKKAISRSDLLMIRLTPTEKQLIAQRAKNAGLKPSEWFRRAAKSARVFPRFTPEESRWFRMLSGMANNLNQLTHLRPCARLAYAGFKMPGTGQANRRIVNQT